MPTIVIDLDGTLTVEEPGVPYEDLQPNAAIVSKLHEYRANGFSVAIFTARNMRSHAKSVGKINALTLPRIVEWLDKHNIPYDEIHVGKPWPEDGGFYVDDKAIRPDEFASLEYSDVLKLVGDGK